RGGAASSTSPARTPACGFAGAWLGGRRSPSIELTANTAAASATMHHKARRPRIAGRYDRPKELSTVALRTASPPTGSPRRQDEAGVRRCASGERERR